MAHYVFGYAAHQQAVEAMAAVGSYHNNIGAELGGTTEYAVGGGTIFGKMSNIQITAVGFNDTLDNVFRRFLLHLNDLGFIHQVGVERRYHIGCANGSWYDRLHRVDQADIGFVKTGQFEPVLCGVFGVFAVVNSDEYPAYFHGNWLTVNILVLFLRNKLLLPLRHKLNLWELTPRLKND